MDSGSVASKIKARTSEVLVCAARTGKDVGPVLADLNAMLDRELKAANGC